ncbi:MAG: DUF1844 domain-containing protein [Pirellulales bacterium]
MSTEASAVGPEQVPPATLAFLIQTLASQAMLALGVMPNPLTQKTEKNLPLAKHFIDMLDVLEAKTEGNRTPEESALLRSMTHQLRMGYVEMQKTS